MASITYNEVFSRFFTKVEAFDLFEENLTDAIRGELLCNWLHSAAFDPYVRRLFTSITLIDGSDTSKLNLGKGVPDLDVDQDQEDNSQRFYIDDNGSPIPNLDIAVDDDDELAIFSWKDGGSSTTPTTPDDDKEKHTPYTIEYTLKYSIDEDYDNEFIIEVLATGMALAWIRPKVNSIINTAQIFSSSDSKFYSQANHLSELRNLRDDLKAELRNMIRDRGYANNSYLDGSGSSQR